MYQRHPEEKGTIIGAGIIGALQAYFTFLNAKKNNHQVRITMYEKNKSVADTTVSNIAPSLTPDEILSVVPRGQDLVNKLKKKFDFEDGIFVTDIDTVNNSAAEKFIAHVQEYGKDDIGHNDRTRVLLELGRKSMDMWQEIYDQADDELKKIMDESNFNPCRESRNSAAVLHDGYRIDLIYNINEATIKAHSMISVYTGLGYKNCEVLTPDEVISRDPYLTDFCVSNSILDGKGNRQWKSDAAAIWRPGGCIDTSTFMPKFFNYLEKVMGTYVNSEGKTKNCFQIKYDRQVVSVEYSSDRKTIVGLGFFGRDAIKRNKNHYEKSNYTFCPGGNVGTLGKLGFKEPANAGFAGPSLKLTIPLSDEMFEKYKNLNHCMEEHKVGIVLAKQARAIVREFESEKIDEHKKVVVVRVAGTKAFYSNVIVNIMHEFVINRNVVQLNMIKDVFPELISFILGRDVTGQTLDKNDLFELENKKVAVRWAGNRAVYYDNFPTLGKLYNEQGEIDNALTITGAGSGGVSFGPILVHTSSFAFIDDKKPELIEQALQYSDSRRGFTL